MEKSNKKNQIHTFRQDNLEIASARPIEDPKHNMGKNP